MADSFTPTDGASFSEALTALIEAAYTNGTELNGAWKCSIAVAVDGTLPGAV